MDHKQLRKRCEARLRELDIPIPFDARSFCSVLARQWGRPIVLQPVASATGPSGLWAAGPSVDVIFYERATSPLHQEHIILHEVCHLLCGHRPAPMTETGLSSLLFPHLNPAMVQHVLQRMGYPTEEEYEAELQASLILEQAASSASRGRVKADGDIAGLLGRLGTALEEGTGAGA